MWSGSAQDRGGSGTWVFQDSEEEQPRQTRMSQSPLRRENFDCLFRRITVVGGGDDAKPASKLTNSVKTCGCSVHQQMWSVYTGLGRALTAEVTETQHCSSHRTKAVEPVPLEVEVPRGNLLERKSWVNQAAPHGLRYGTYIHIYIHIYSCSIMYILIYMFHNILASLIAQLVKNLPTMQDIPVRFLDQEDPLEKG